MITTPNPVNPLRGESLIHPLSPSTMLCHGSSYLLSAQTCAIPFCIPEYVSGHCERKYQRHLLNTWRIWAHLGSNQGPTGYEPVALPAELWAHNSRPINGAILHLNFLTLAIGFVKC